MGRPSRVHHWSVPRLAQPNGSEDAKEPVAILGNLVKTSIVRTLRATPNLTMGPLCDALGMTAATIYPYLSELEDGQIVVADPPKAVRTRGMAVRYRVNDQAVTELYLRLGQAIGEI